MVDIKKEIKDNEVLVLSLSGNYKKNMLNVTKDLSSQFERLCYVTLNQQSKELIEKFKAEKIDLNKFSFIDGVTNTTAQISPAKNCTFITAPNALTEMNIAIMKECKKKKAPSLFILDSLSTLLVYESPSILIEFVHSVVETVKVHKIKIAFTTLNADLNSPLMKDLAMFADNIIEIKEKT